MKRALALAGGGPACGLQIGALKRFAEESMTFDVWALSCIGAWVGVIYNQFDPVTAPGQTETFFREHIFREDQSYAKFPINQVFAPELFSNARALSNFMTDPATYRDLYVPGAMLTAARHNLEFMLDPKHWNRGDFNLLVLENMAAHPLTRYLTSMIYLSKINGLSRIYYPEGSFLQSIDFEALAKPDRPFLYHNAWNLSRQRLEQFSNRLAQGYKQLTPASLCACSALPYVESTVEVDNDTYCEGALVDTVNFKHLLEKHDLEDDPLDEVWVVRIVSKDQVRKPDTLTDALGNLCMLFAASLGEDDVKLFRYHAIEDNWHGRIIEIPVSCSIDFNWNVENFDTGVRAGYRAAALALEDYRAGRFADLKTRPEKGRYTV
jgi:predicted acylesterase/phospholipase RssA